MKKKVDSSIELTSEMEGFYRLFKYEQYADKILQKGNIVNVITKEIYKADIAIKGEYILRVGECLDLIGNDTELIDLDGKYILPGFLDYNLHCYPPNLTLLEYTKLSLPLGVTGLILEQGKTVEKINLLGVNKLDEEIKLMPHHIYFRNSEIDKEIISINSNKLNTKKSCNDLKNNQYILLNEDLITNRLIKINKLVNENKISSNRIIVSNTCCFKKDIRHREYLKDMLKRIIKSGFGSIEAIQMVTINIANWLGIKDIGSISPGKFADLVVLNGVIEEMDISKVFLKGKVIADKGSLLIELPNFEDHKISKMYNTFSESDKVNIGKVKIEVEQEKINVRCIGLIPGKKTTNAIEVQLRVKDNYIVPCADRDILPLIIVGKDKELIIGKGFVKGFKISQGAIAQSVFNGKHNIIAIGKNYEDIVLAINCVMKLKGGIAIVRDNQEIKNISIVNTNVMKSEDYEYRFIDKLMDLTKIAEKELGCEISSPFMRLSFLTLDKIPKWKITINGLIDVETHKIIPTIIS